MQTTPSTRTCKSTVLLCFCMPVMANVRYQTRTSSYDNTRDSWRDTFEKKGEKGVRFISVLSRYPKGKPLFPSFVMDLYKDNLKIKDVLYCQEIFLVFCIKRRS